MLATSILSGFELDGAYWAPVATRQLIETSNLECVRCQLSLAVAGDTLVQDYPIR